MIGWRLGPRAGGGSARLASAVDREGLQIGRVAVLDVYRGLETVPRGTIRRLRIVGIPPKDHPRMNWPAMGDSTFAGYEPKRVWRNEGQEAFLEVAETTPFVLTVNNLHWGDEVTVDLLASLAASGAADVGELLRRVEGAVPLGRRGRTREDGAASLSAPVAPGVAVAPLRGEAAGVGRTARAGGVGVATGAAVGVGLGVGVGRYCCRTSCTCCGSRNARGAAAVKRSSELCLTAAPTWSFDCSTSGLVLGSASEGACS